MNRESIKIAHELIARLESQAKNLQEITNEPSSLVIRISITNCGSRINYIDTLVPKNIIADYISSEIDEIKLELTELGVEL